ncbi:MAG: osta-like protein [Verrucomicrobiaceae bacterium]|nr:osta-like protein [Verrucomicrobiaceae bacterium]
MRFARLTAILIGLPMLALAQNKSPTSGLLESLTSNIDIEGLETSYDPETGIATAKGEAHIKYGDTEVEAGRADYNANTGDVIAKEHVTIVKAGVIYKGENIIYNVNTNELHGDMVRSGVTHDTGTLFYTMDRLQTSSKYVDKVEGEGAIITTHDLANPNYHIKAKSMTIYPGDRLTMRGVTLYAGSTPVFWFPYITQPLDDENGYLFAPGYSSTWGAYLLNQYGIIYGDHTLAKYHLDLRSMRGIAVGGDFISLKNKDNDNWGRLKLYYANDASPLTNKANEDRVDVPTGRYRVNFQHRIYITDPGERTWFMDFDINKMSDEFFLEDFFAGEFLNNREPDNQVSLIRSDPRYTATLMAKFQLNKFYEADTRLPEIAFDFTRQPIFNTGLYYQGNTSFDILREKIGTVDRQNYLNQQAAGQAFVDNKGNFNGTGQSFDVSQSLYRRLNGLPDGAPLAQDEVSTGLYKLQDLLAEDGFNRFHTYHEVLFPKTVFGGLNLVPRFGLGYTSYSDIRGALTDPKTGKPYSLSSAGRTLVHVGLDASFKMTKTWDDVHNEKLGLDGLKHVVQPFLNYSYLNADTIKGLPAIDRTIDTTRPLPLDIPFYTGIDNLRTWNQARMGVRNFLQTKRDYVSATQNDDGTDTDYNSSGDSVTQAYTWAGLNTYFDVYGTDPSGLNRDISNLYNELFWRPVPWLTFFADTQLPIGGAGSYTEANYGVTFMPNRDLSVSLGNLYIHDHPFFSESNLLYSKIYARINDNWGLSMNHIFEAATHTLEYQSYSVHRDLNSWVASLGVLQRDNAGVKDLGLIFSLTLKEFPQVTVPLDTDPNPTGRSLH